MNLIYFYDFETSGFPLWSKPSGDPGQPHIVQCAAVMVETESFKTVGDFCLIAKPDGWDIPKEASDVHGITTEYARKVGVSEGSIVATLLAFHGVATTRIGHNQPFDARIMRIALKRFKTELMADSWKAGESYCTQKASTPIVKLPPTEKMLAAGRRGNKTCGLAEAYQHFMGKPMEDAHDAMADVLATMAVYWNLVEQKLTEGPQLAIQARSSNGQGSGGDGVGFL